MRRPMIFNMMLFVLWLFIPFASASRFPQWDMTYYSHVYVISSNRDADTVEGFLEEFFPGGGSIDLEKKGMNALQNAFDECHLDATKTHKFFFNTDYLRIDCFGCVRGSVSYLSDGFVVFSLTTFDSLDHVKEQKMLAALQNKVDGIVGYVEYGVIEAGSETVSNIAEFMSRMYTRKDVVDPRMDWILLDDDKSEMSLKECLLKLYRQRAQDFDYSLCHMDLEAPTVFSTKTELVIYFDNIYEDYNDSLGTSYSFKWKTKMMDWVGFFEDTRMTVGDCLETLYYCYYRHNFKFDGEISPQNTLFPEMVPEMSLNETGLSIRFKGDGGDVHMLFWKEQYDKTRLYLEQLGSYDGKIGTVKEFLAYIYHQRVQKFGKTSKHLAIEASFRPSPSGFIVSFLDEEKQYFFQLGNKLRKIPVRILSFNDWIQSSTVVARLYRV